MEKNKKNKKEKLMPNRLYWTIYYILGGILISLKHNVKIRRGDFNNRDKKKGCVVLYNHVCFDDHYMIAKFLGKNMGTFVITKRFMYNKIIAPLLRGVRAITRDQFKADMASILKMKRITSEGGILVISPAGQMSISGDVPYIHPSIIKLLKMCKVDVYTIQIHGSYLAYPKWGLSKRSYKIELDCHKTLSSDDLINLPKEECYNKVLTDLSINDLLEQKTKMIPIKGKKLAEGMENFLFICPKCFRKYSIEVSNDILKCKCCGNSVRLNKYGFLEGIGNDYVLMQNESLWYDFQKNIILNEMKQDDYKLTSSVTLYSNEEKSNELVVFGSGTLCFDKERLYYDGTMKGNVIHKEFNLSAIYQLPFEPAKRFNIPDDENFFEFVPSNQLQVIEWVIAIDAYNSYRQSNDTN